MQDSFLSSQGSSPQQRAEKQSFYDSRMMVQNLPAAIYTCDLEGRITYFNDAAAELWGRHPKIGEDYWCGSWKIYFPDGSPMNIDTCPMARTLTEKRAVSGEEIIVERPDGHRIFVQPHPRPIVDDRGKMIGAVNMLIDISESKKQELKIRENEKKYRELSESLAQQVDDRTANLKRSEERYFKMVEEVEDYAILMLDRDGTVLNWNRGAENIKGYSENEIVGKNFRVFYLQSDRDEQLPEKLISEAATTGKAMHEGWRVRKDGSRFWGYIVITALHSSDGSIIGFSKVTRDLTERKLAEDKLQNYARDIEAQNKQLEEYAHVTSHDLQEPLRKINIFSGIVSDNIDNKEVVFANLTKIKSAATRMSVLIQDILKYSKISQNDDIFETTSLDTVLSNVLEDLDLLIEEKHATIKHSELPIIEAVPVQMHQLFFNLIGNALKFSEHPPIIEISASIVSGSAVKQYKSLNPFISYIKITIRDNGIGFDQQYEQKVFKLFQRLGDAKTGTGIGLALCKKIVEKHSGFITVSSKPGKGSCFTILLPAKHIKRD